MSTATKPFEEMNTLWEILEAALEDVRKVEAMPGVYVNMDNWVYTVNGQCGVCLAGATLILRCGVKTTGSCNPVYLPEAVEKRCYALNELRCGCVDDAYEYLHDMGRNDIDLDRNVCDYHEDRDEWHADMAALLADLKAANI